jgi:hypothetical protein
VEPDVLGGVMTISISAVVFLLVVVGYVLRKGGLRSGHAIACVLLGFYLAGSRVAPNIQSTTANVARMISRIHLYTGRRGAVNLPSVRLPPWATAWMRSPAALPSVDLRLPESP